MAASYHVGGVDKRKCIVCIHRHQFYTIKPTHVPSTGSPNTLVPSYPQEFHSTWLIINHTWTGVDDIGVINAQDQSIVEPVVLGGIIVTFIASTSQGHDIVMGSGRVHCVLRALDVIRSIVDTDKGMSVQAIVFEED
jgi:hypothetical protein